MRSTIGEAGTLELSFRGIPPRADHLCRLLPLLSDAGVQELVVDWEESFPWSIDARLAGPGSFSEKEIEGICSVAARSNVTLVPHLARHGLPRVLDRVENFARLARISSDWREMDVSLAAALRMAERVIEDLLAVTGDVARIALGAVGSCGDQKLQDAYRRRFVQPLQQLLRSRGIEPLLQPPAPDSAPASDEFQPIEASIARAFDLSAGDNCGLATLVCPVAESAERLDRFTEESWRTLRKATAGLHAAARHAGNRAEFLADAPLQQRLNRLGADCEMLRAELVSALDSVMEAEVIAGYLTRRLAPLEELAATTLARVRTLR